MTRHRHLYAAAQLPVFQNRMFASRDAARDCVRGDLQIVQDDTTGLVFNRAFDPALMVYDADYQNEQGHSGVFREHLQAMAAVVRRQFGGQSLIEVGCGKGHFLELLQADGFRITGLDPTYEGSNTAVRRDYFTPETGLRADGLILRHVLEHVRDPFGFLCQLRDANGGSGRVCIEVPCLEWIARHHAWFDLFYEHVNYFRLSDFARMFGTVYESGHCFGGQYVYAVADLATLRQPVATAADRFDFPTDLMDKVADSAARVARARQGSRQEGKAGAAVWGGASKGVIFSLFMERAGAPLEMIIDINPAKQGKYIAASGMRVHGPHEAMQHLAPGADLFVMNGNYRNEIEAMTDHRFNCLTLEH